MRSSKNNMIETHPYVCFVPYNASYLLLGSFPGKPDEVNDWFYGAKRNQFWKILEIVYEKELKTREEKEKLLSILHFAVTDVIYKAERIKGTNLDNNLKIIEYNNKVITDILIRHKIEKIYFSSRFVETIFRRTFRNLMSQYAYIDFITLPSPSPRYAAINMQEKVVIYKKLLPKITSNKNENNERT